MVGGDIIITFDPLREYMQRHGKSIYSLTRDKIIGGATLDRIRANSPGVTLDTIDRICKYLQCKPTNVIAYKPDE